MDSKTVDPVLQIALVQTIQITSIMSTIIPLIIISCFVLVKQLRKVNQLKILRSNSL